MKQIDLNVNVYWFPDEFTSPSLQLHVGYAVRVDIIRQLKILICHRVRQQLFIDMYTNVL